MLSPKRVRWRKVHKGRRRGHAHRGSSISFGDFAIQAVDDGWITDRQIEASRIAIARSIKRGGKVWVRIFPQKSITKKAAETRMGSGKGNPEYWAASVRPGHVLFEVSGVPREAAAEAFRLAGHKLPIRTRFIYRE